MLLALVELLLLALLLVLWGTGFVVTSALLGGVVEHGALRAALALVPSTLLPLLLLARLARRRGRAVPHPGAFVALGSAVVAVGLSLGFADDVGRALRRHGDWFLGERNGAVARAIRGGVGLVATRLERFDPPREVAPVILPPDPAVERPLGPFLPGQEPPPPAPRVVAWFHPLLGGERAMPGSESRRFGAVRPQPRPTECELGHCGVDLGYTFGQAVVAIHDGVVERIEEDEARGGRAGRYVRIGHRDGTVVSRYVHLDSIRAGLREGTAVHGGEVIGRVGRTGVEHSGPHLHFGLSLRPGGRPGGVERYVDPEPLLTAWTLAAPAPAAVAQAAHPPEIERLPRAAL